MKQPDQETELLVADTQVKTVANLRIAGVPVSEICRQLKMTRHFVNKLMSTDEFKDYLREQSEKLLADAAHTWKAAMNDMVSDSLRVIKKKLKEDDLEAVKLVMKSIGVEKTGPAAVESGAITVVLPDYQQHEKVIEVEHE